MAATRLIALHKNKGKSVATCLKSRTDYAQNPEKTKQGELVSSYECSPLTVDEEFMLSKRQYELATGRRQKSDVIAYQIRQSFKPGEITAEEANKVGYELAMRFTKGKYAFIIATHTDREHIHNHIIYNSTALDSTRKFRDFLLSGLAVQRLSDLICLEHQLSVIEIKPYRERQKRTLYPPRESNRDKLCAVIDNILLSEKPASFEGFLQKLEQRGYEIKRGKYTSVKGTRQKRFIRFRTLGVDGKKDFSPLIRQALELGGYEHDRSMSGINGGHIMTTGFAHGTVLANAQKVISAIRQGKIKHIFLVGGCDGAHPGRNYYTEFVKQTPMDTLVLTLACGKFRFNDLDLGEIEGLPRIMDMGQCNDAYSAIKVAVALAEAFDCEVNDLPLTLVLTWYEQKAVCILLTLLALGIKNIYLGPTFPAFLSEGVTKVLRDAYNLQPITAPEQDLDAILGRG